MAKIIAIANQKGGVGKTTTAVNMAAALVQRGRRVLCIDLDPQANLSSYLAFEKDPENPVTTTGDLLQAVIRDAELNLSVCRNEQEGIDYIPASIKLSAVAPEIQNAISREKLLRYAIRQDAIMAAYDFIIIDCPPTLEILLTNALTAADSVVIPVQPHPFAVEGLGDLNHSISTTRRFLNESLELDGVLVTMYDSTNLSKQVVEALREMYGKKVYVTKIRKSVKAAESSGRSVSLVSTNGKLGADYENFADEYLNRVCAVKEEISCQ